MSSEQMMASSLVFETHRSISYMTATVPSRCEEISSEYRQLIQYFKFYW